MRKINLKDLYVSIVDSKKKDELLDFNLNHNLEIANFHSPQVLDSNYGEDLEKFKNLVISHNKMCSLHGPMANMNYESRDPKIREVVAYRYDQILKIAEKLKAKHIVIHSTYNSLTAQPDKKERWVRAAKEFFPPILEKAEKLGVTFLLENVFDPEPGPIKSLVQEINSPYFKICLDIGHWFLFSKLPIKNWIKTFESDLAYFHLHDNGGEFDEHLPLGKGRLPILDVFEALQDSPARPEYCIEVRSTEAIQESIAFLREKKIISES